MKQMHISLTDFYVISFSLFFGAGVILLNIFL